MSLLSVSACAVDAGGTGESRELSVVAQTLSGPAQGNACHHDPPPPRRKKNCKRDRDCSPDEYCADDHEPDDHRGNGHDKHEHRHGGPDGVCRPLDIDDGNPCTVDSIDEQGVVRHQPAPAGTSCADSNACNGAEVCDSTAHCKAGTAPVLSDGNPCTVDACSPSFGVTHQLVADGTSCADNDVCNGAESCVAGECRPGTPLPFDDNNPCTVDSCGPAGVVHEPKPEGASCDNGDHCSGAGQGQCTANGSCVVSAPSPIDDGNPCTIDACDPETGVTHRPAPIGSACDDGNVCNGVSVCDASGACVDAAPPNVDDLNPCTADACHPTNGVAHSPVAAGTSCSDGLLCNGAETCSEAGVCQAGPSPPTDDGNPCTIDGCDATAGVVHRPVSAGTACGDSDVCNGTERCDALGTCQGGLPAPLDDGNPCTEDTCSPSEGVSHRPLAAGTPCSDADACNGAETCDGAGSCVPGSLPTVDDGNPCTVDTCHAAVGATHQPAPMGTSCADPDPCNGSESCDGTGRCSPGQPLELDDHNPCTADSCDEERGLIHVAMPSGTGCSDGDQCNGEERCDDAGHCLTLAPSTADDGNPCTIDSCDAVAGVSHVPAPAGTSCDDGNACNGVSRCDGSGGCLAGSPPQLDDQNPCTVDRCDAALGIGHVPVATGTSCDDGNGCNGVSTCSASGSCEPGAPLLVDDGNPCTSEHCDPVLGLHSAPLAAGVSCSDNNACNGSESCDGSGGCVPGAPPALDDANPCTADSCDPLLGVQHLLAPAGTACGNSDACDGDERCDASGVCHAGTPLCDDGDACNGQETCNADGSCSAHPLPPLLSLTPLPSVTSDASVTLSGTTSSPSPVVLTVEPGSLSLVVNGSAEPQPFSLPVPLVEGANHFGVVATTQAQCSASLDVTVLRDSGAPSVSIDVPARLGVKESARATVTASDPNGVAEVRFRVLLRGEVVLEQVRTTAPFAFDFAVTEGALAGDILQIEASARDAAGNRAEASASVTVTAAGIVVGRVLSDATGQALGSASVRLEQQAGETKADGRYVFGVDASEALVRAWRRGFTSAERKVSVELGVGSVAVDARLTPLAEPVLVNGSDPTWDVALGSWDGQALSAKLTARAAAFSGAVALHATPLTPQGLPGLLPPGWSPVAALELRLAGADLGAAELDPEAAFPALDAPLTLELSGLPAGTLPLVAYDRTAHGWRVLENLTGGAPLTRPLAGLGAFAVVQADTASAPASVAGSLLGGVAPLAIASGTSAQGAAAPGSLPAQGGITQGRIVLAADSGLPSGTLVSAALSESYSLSSGLTASSETWLQDVILYRAQVPQLPSAALTASTLLGAVFPIATSLSYGIAELASGKLHIDVLAGREHHRGKIGGHAAVEVEHAGASLSLVEGSLEADTLVDIERADVSPFVIRSADLVPLAQLGIDLAGAVLTTPAELTLVGVPLAIEETPLLARLERLDGVAYPNVVSLGTYTGSEWSFTAGDGFSGVLREGTYVVYRATLPLGFVAGTTLVAGAPVQAFLSTGAAPFVTLAALDGSYRLPTRPGSAAVSARVPGTNLVARNTTSVTLDHTSPLDLTLLGEVSSATVTPSHGSVAVPRTAQVTLTSDIALEPSTVTLENIRLFRGDPADAVRVPARLQLSASARTVALIPDARLAEATSYTLQASGLRDAKGGVVTVVVTTFRTEVEAAPTINLGAIDVSLDAAGNALVSAPAETLRPGTTVIITNEGNGHVTSCSVGNEGSLGCELPAGIDDTLVITIADPDGATTSLQRGQYRLPDGRTAIGRAGGVVQGPGGVELRIPEGALAQGATFSITALGPEAFNERPSLPDTQFGGILKIESPEAPDFKREVDLAFPRPPAAPDGAFFYVYRRLQDQQSGAVAFEVIDHAFPEAPTLEAKIITASPPFPGVQNSRSLSFSSTGNVLVPNVTTMYLMQWGYDPTRRHNSTSGVVHGKVSQTRWNPNQGGVTAPSIVPLPGALVGFVNADGVATFASTVAPAPTVAISGSDGTFAIWHPTALQGSIRVGAIRTDRGGSASSECPAVPSTSQAIQCATAILGGVLSTKPSLFPSLQAYSSIGEANLLFPPQPPNQPVIPPAIDIKIFREVEGKTEPSNGIVAEGQRLVFQFHAESADVRSVELVHEGSTTELSLSPDPRAPGDKLASYAPLGSGSYTIRATALPAFGSLVASSAAFRVIAAGGTVTQPVPHAAPAVIAAQTIPELSASCVAPGVFPSVVFTEPVSNVPGNVTLLGPPLVAGGDPELIPLALTGITPQGDPTSLSGATASTELITSLTIEPQQKLKYGTSYRLLLGDGIRDTLDPLTPDDEQLPLDAYETSFTTLEPETLPPIAVGFSTGGLAAVGDRTFIAQHAGSSTLFRGFDIGDPGSPSELSSATRTILGRPMSIAAERDESGDARVLVATGPTDRSIPSNLRLFRVRSMPTPQAELIAATSLSTTAIDGIVRRVVMRGDFAYAVTTQRGVQVVDLGFARQILSQAGGEGASVRLALNTDGRGFAHEAVVSSVPILGRSGRPAFLADLKVTDLADGFVQPIVVVTGEVGLGLVNPQTGDVLFSGASQPDDGFRGRALAVGRVGTRDVAVTVGELTGSPALRVFDISIPRQPHLLGHMDLPERALDVVVRDRLALVGSEASVLLVSLDQGADQQLTPSKAGTISNLGGRLAFTQSGLLLSAAVSVSGEALALDGVRAATLEPLPVILPIDPPLGKHIANGSVREIETLTDSKVRVAVFAGCGQPTQGSLALDRVPLGDVAGTATHVREWAVALQSSGNLYEGSVPIPDGERFPDTDTSGEMRRLIFSVPILSASGATIGTRRSAPRELRLRTFDLRLDSNNDTQIDNRGSVGDRADEDAEEQGRRFAFWLSDSSDPVEPLEDWAQVRLRIPALPGEHDKVFITWPNGQWRLGRRSSAGKDYLKYNQTPTEQVVSSSAIALEGQIEIPHDWLVEGDNYFLARFENLVDGSLPLPFGEGPNARLVVRYERQGALPLNTDEVLVEVRRMDELMSMYSARDPDPDVYTPRPTFEPTYKPVPPEATDITIAVHGFNVDDQGATKFSETYLKRLYWVGRPVLQQQAEAGKVPWFVGLSWPGDRSKLSNLYGRLPDDEFHAFQTGDSLARLLSSIHASNRSISIVAHSLGNLVINSALARDSMNGVVQRYVMNQAAISAETFGAGHAIDGELRAQAEQQGYSSNPGQTDAKWVELWRQANINHCGQSDCEAVPGAECTAPMGAVPTSAYEKWCALRSRNASELDVRFAKRWSSRSNSRPWYGIFETNTPHSNPAKRTEIFNTYNRSDFALSMILMLQWGRQKPDLGLLVGIGNDAFGLAPHSDDLDRLYWGSVGIDLSDPARTIDPTTRRRAELSYYFSPLARAAGQEELPVLNGQHNFDMEERIENIDVTFSSEPGFQALREVFNMWRELHGFTAEAVLTAPQEAAVEDIVNRAKQRFIGIAIAHEAFEELNQIADIKEKATKLGSIVGGVYRFYLNEILRSHGYMTDGKVGDVWCAYELFEDLLNGAAASDCSRQNP